MDDIVRANNLQLENEALLEQLQKLKSEKRAMLLEIDTLKNERDKYRYDHLTNMMGRIDFEEQFKKFYLDFNTSKKDFTFGLLDINNLHALNRDHGYEAGDNLIKLVSEELKKVYTDSLLYRIGGDEFAILCRNIDCPLFLNRFRGNEILLKNITFGIVQVQDVHEDQRKDKSTLFKSVDKIVIDKKLQSNKGRRSSD